MDAVFMLLTLPLLLSPLPTLFVLLGKTTSAFNVCPEPTSLPGQYANLSTRFVPFLTMCFKPAIPAGTDTLFGTIVASSHDIYTCTTYTINSYQSYLEIIKLSVILILLINQCKFVYCSFIEEIIITVCETIQI
jgi:hypothetical protein